MAINLNKHADGGLEHDVELLRRELDMLQPAPGSNEPGIAVTHHAGQIVVYAPAHLKAYIPKRFNKINVVVREPRPPKKKLSAQQTISLDDILTATEDQ